MQEQIEARIALCKCSEAQKIYGVRFETCEKGWKYTWAFPIKESSAKREGYDATLIEGNIEPGEDYPGCPFCGATHFIICSCGKISCLNGITQNGLLTCEWCGLSGTGSAYDGSGISSGGDI